MKTLLKIGVIFCCLSSIVYAKEVITLNNNLKEYDKLFEKIAEKRLGADVSMINELKNPFIVIMETSRDGDVNQTAVEPLYTLEATLNQKAKINGIWYKNNDSIGLFKVTNISRNRVILQNEIEKKELVIRTKDENNIKIFSK